MRALGEKALANAALAVFEAEATQRIFESSIGDDRCFTLPYGLDRQPIDNELAKFDRRKHRIEVEIAEDAEVLLCVGSVEPRKAQVLLAHAFELIANRHPKANLVFVGMRNNEDAHLLGEWTASLACADRIKLVPMTPDIHSWYGLSDVLVCASDIESLPRSVLEAMAWRLPVLATSVFGLEELIEDGKTGWLCAHRDVEALAVALEQVLSTPAAERAKIGRRGRRLIEQRHCLDTYCEEFAELLDWVDEGKDATPPRRSQPDITAITAAAASSPAEGTV